MQILPSTTSISENFLIKLEINIICKHNQISQKRCVSHVHYWRCSYQEARLNLAWKSKTGQSHQFLITDINKNEKKKNLFFLDTLPFPTVHIMTYVHVTRSVCHRYEQICAECFFFAYYRGKGLL